MSDANKRAQIEYLQSLAARYRVALENIAGDEPRAVLNGTTAEGLRNIARTALSLPSHHRGTE